MLTECPECNRKISSDAKICPQCGADVEKRNAFNNSIATIVISIVIVIAVLNKCASAVGELTGSSTEEAKPAVSVQSSDSSSTVKSDVTSPSIPTTRTGQSTHETMPTGVSENAKIGSDGVIIQSPAENCKGETNFLSNNSCMWRECEKPEFADMAECENRKAQPTRVGG